MARRADHEGSIRQRQDGRWEARIEIGGHRLSRYGTTRAEVVAKLRALQTTPILAAPTPTLTLGAWVETWLREKELRPSTRATYQRTLALPLAHLSAVRLSRLSPAQLRATFVLLREQGRGARRLQLAHGYLKSCLERAVALGLIPTNPLVQVIRPRWSSPTKRYWSLEETAHFLAVAHSSSLRYAPLFVLLVTTGLRLSEALALEQADQDAVTISQGQVWDRTTGYVTSTVKTPTSRRQILVPASGRAALTAIPFRTQGGRIPRPAILYATLLALCSEAGVPPVTPHALRHQHAALAYAATGDMYAVQKRLGHANVTTTMGLYGFGLGTDAATRDAFDTLMASTLQGHRPDRATP